MSRSHTLILLLSLSLCSARVTKEACDPVCVTADTFIADPYSCGYYYCISTGTPSGVYNCPDGQIFDGNVKPNHEDPKEPCKASVATCTPKCAKPECQIVCRDVFDVIITPTNCSFFSVCIRDNGNNFTAHQDECPSDRPYFNGADCTSHKENCCNVCDADCTGEDYGVEIPDPDNCNSYYTCLGNGDMSISTACPVGGHFGIEDGKCIQGANCTNLCETTTEATGIVSVPSDPTTDPATGST